MAKRHPQPQWAATRAPLMDKAWAAPGAGERPEAYLESARVEIAGEIPVRRARMNLETRALTAIGLIGPMDPTGTAAAVRIRPVVARPAAARAAHCAHLAWAVEVETSEGTGRATTRVLADRVGNGEPLALPWPEPEEPNVFRDGARAYTVRVELRPRAGVHADEYPASKANSATGTGIEREITINARPGTHHPRFVLIAAAPRPNAPAGDVETALPDLRMVVHPAPDRARRPFTVHGLEAIRARLASAQGRRANDPRHRAFTLEPGSTAEQELEHWWEQHGLIRAPGNGWVRADDIDVLCARLADPRPFETAQSIHAIGRQQARTPIETLRDTLRATASTVLRRTLDLESFDGEPTAHDAMVLPGPDTRSARSLNGIARRIAAHLEEAPRTQIVAEALSDWRRRARVQYLEMGATARGADARPSNPLAFAEICQRVVLGAHRASKPANAYREDGELSLPADAWPMLCPLTRSPNNNERASITASHVADLVRAPGIGWVPAVRVLDAESAQPRTVSVSQLAISALEIDGAVLINGKAAPAGTPPRYRIADVGDTYAPSIRQGAPLVRWSDQTRIGMAAHMMMSGARVRARADDRPRLIVATDGEGRQFAPEANLPTTVLRVAAINTAHTHEDCIAMSPVTAARLAMTLPIEHRLTRRPAVETEREYAGPGRALYADVADDTGLSEAAFKKLDENGLIRVGETLEPGDAIQLWRAPADDAPQGRAWRYAFDPAPAHGRARVTDVQTLRSGDAETDAEADLGAFLAALTEDGPSADAEDETQIVVRSVDQVGFGTGTKVTTVHGTKGIVQTVDAAELPLARNDATGAEGETVDMVLPLDSTVARMAMADWVALRMGHLIETRTARLADACATLERRAHDARATPRRRLDSLARRGDDAARQALETLARSGWLQTLHAHPAPGDPPAPAETVSDLAGVANQPDPRTWSLAQLRALDAIVSARPGRTCVTYHAGAAGAERARIERALEYVPDEECTASPGPHTGARQVASGLVDMVTLIQHGRKQTNEHPLCATGFSALTGQALPSPGRNPARIGFLEADVLRSAAPRAALDLRTFADGRAARRAQQRLDAGAAAVIPSERPRERLAIEETAALLMAACGWEWRPDGPVVPIGDEGIETLSAGALPTDALERAYEADGTPSPGGLQDTSRFRAGARRTIAHIELAEPILLPGALATQGQTPHFLSALLDIEPKELRELATTSAHGGQENGPQQIKTRLRILEHAVASDLDSVLEHAEDHAPRFPDRFVDAVRTLAERPDFRPSDWVVSKFPVLPPALRRAHIAPGARNAASVHRLDRTYAQLARINAHITNGTLHDADTTKRLSEGAGRAYRRCVTMLGGKRGLLNRHLFGFYSAVSTRSTIAPARPHRCPSTHVEISRRNAAALYRHWAEPILRETYGMSQEGAAKRIDAWARERPGSTPDDQTDDIMRRVLGLAAPIVMRAPALHKHSAVALEALVRSPHDATTLDPAEDDTTRLPVLVDEGLNADHDGDSVNAYMPLTGAGALDARLHLNPSEHLVRIGSGAALGMPSQAARSGLLTALNAPGATPRERLAGLAQDCAETQCLASAIGDAAPEEWDRTGGLRPATLARAMGRLHSDTAHRATVRLRVVDRLWNTGMDHAADAPGVTLAAFEALHTLLHEHPTRDGTSVCDTLPHAGTHQPETTPAAARRAEKIAASKRFEALVERIAHWGADPQRFLDEYAESPDPAPALAERALGVFRTLGGGGRLRPAQVARIAGEMGQPIKHDERAAGPYVHDAIVAGIGAKALATTQYGGGECKIAGKSAIARAGFLAHRLNQVAGHLLVTADDCGVDASELSTTLAPDPVLEGATLAAALTLGDRTLSAGHRLTRSDLEEANTLDARLPVRTLDACQAGGGGVCSACVGGLRGLGGATPEPGTAIGTLAATSVNEQISQKLLRRFHLAAIRPSTDHERPMLCDTFTSAAARGTDGEMMPLEPDTGADPYEGWLRAIYYDTHQRGGATAAGNDVARALHALCVHGAAEDTDPTLLRTIAYTLTPRDPDCERMAPMDETTVRNGPERHAGTGTDPEVALAHLARPDAARLRDPLGQAHHHARSAERTLHDPMIAFHAAQTNDLDTLAALERERPEALLARDALGRTALFEAHSKPALELLLRAGNDAIAPAPHDPRGLNAVDVLSVRPLAPDPADTRSVGERRADLVKTVLTRSAGKAAVRASAAAHIRATCDPLAPKARAAARRHTNAVTPHAIRAHAGAGAAR